MVNGVATWGTSAAEKKPPGLLKLPISVICMTYNEEKNIVDCLQSVHAYVQEIHVVDSFSTDRTLELASNYTKCIYKHPFESHARQLQWALETLPLSGKWILRLDADERWADDGFRKLEQILRDPDVRGVYVNMKIYFMGRWIRHGDFYPNRFMRVFTNSDLASVEQRWVDEHIVVTGKTICSDIDVVESNYDRQENISLWISKHNNYSTREAIDQLVLEHCRFNGATIAAFWGNKTQRKRWVKDHLYSRLPLFVRPALYFVYRYSVKLGFLDGVEGFLFHFLQGFWYRFLVDVKIYQLRNRMRKNGSTLPQAVKELYGYEVKLEA